MKIAILTGSVRTGRKSIRVSKYLEKRLKASGIEVFFLDLLDYNFPIMEERMRFLPLVPPRMKEFSSILSQVDGLIIVSPEYNGSYSGVLKNTLDYFKSEYIRKPIGLVTVSSAKFAGVNAMQHLQAWAIHVKCIVSPYKLMVDWVEEKFSPDGDLLDQDFEESVDTFTDNLFWLIRVISANPFKKS